MPRLGATTCSWCVFWGLLGWLGRGDGATILSAGARMYYTTNTSLNLLSWNATSDEPLSSVSLLWRSFWTNQTMMIARWFVDQYAGRGAQRIPTFHAGPPATLRSEWTVSHTRTQKKAERREYLKIRYTVSIDHDWAGRYFCRVTDRNGLDTSRGIVIRLGLGCVGRSGAQEPRPIFDCGPRCPGTFRGPLHLMAWRIDKRGQRGEGLDLQLSDLGADWIQHEKENWTLAAARSSAGPFITVRPPPYDDANYQIAVMPLGPEQKHRAFVLSNATDGRATSTTWEKGVCVIRELTKTATIKGPRR